MSKLNLFFLNAGHCFHPEVSVIRGGSFKKIKFPATVAVIEHPTQGITLFDTGYSPRFHEETRHFPNRFYSLITEVHIEEQETAVSQLRQMGIQPRDVRRVILSHFHADHVSGVKDFNYAIYYYLKDGYEHLGTLGNWGAVKAGFLKGLLPWNFEARSRPIVLTSDFPTGFDILGDESLQLVALPGHARGHAGLLVRTANGKSYFLVGDACWLSKSYQLPAMPSPLARLITDDFGQYKVTLQRIHAFSKSFPEVMIVPCHCSEAHRSLALLKNQNPQVSRSLAA